MEIVRVLIVEDSASMRAFLKAQLASDPRIEVVGGAENPIAAREAIKALEPDVITLDINMPGMDGLEFLEKLMRLRPMPVIVVSSEVHGQSKTAVKALSLGAFDCFLKPMNGSLPGAYDGLRDAVCRAAQSKPGASVPTPAPDTTPLSNFRPNDSIIAIGASTGGVDALVTLISGFPINCPPTLITQHMPGSFTNSFATRLNQKSNATVCEAKDGAPLETGKVYLAPGGVAHLEVIGKQNLTCRLTDSPPVSGHRPSVDVLFHSVARLNIPAVGVILTGMGEDGARGLLAMRQAGASTFGQDEESSLVYGMPRVAFEMGAVEKQMPISQLASSILNKCNETRSRAAT